MVGENIPVDEFCKNKIRTRIQSVVDNVSRMVNNDYARLQAQKMITQFCNELKYDLNLTLSEFVEKYPATMQNPMLRKMIPDCAYHYTMHELKDCLLKIKKRI
jgi:hypothetical protein